MKKILVIIFAFLVSCSSVFSANFSVFKLDNGQNVIIQEVRNNPIVIIDTWIKTGSINENDDNNGISHFLEHLFFKGTQKYPVGAFDRILESKGASTNAATSKDYTHYYIKIPSEFFDLALELHSDMLLNPEIPQQELEKERKVVIEEIAKDELLPTNICYENLVKMLYTHHPYKRKVIGDRDTIEKVSRAEILGYYDKFYSPDNMVTVVVGDVDTAETLDKIKKAFSVKNSPAPKYNYKKEQPLKEQKRTESFEDIQAGYILIGFRGTNIDAKDSYALDILATVLGDGHSSVFYRKIKDEKQLATDISVYNSGMKDDGIFYIAANFVPEKYDALEKEIFKQIKEIQNRGITAEQLSLAKNIIERNTYYERESISNIASQLGYVSVTAGGTSYYDNYLKNISKVTLKDVKAVAVKYLQENKSAVSVVLPKNTNCERPVSYVQKTKAEPVLVTEIDDTQKYLLSDGTTLLLTKNDVNDIIGINITIKGGILSENKKAAANLVAALMKKGTKKYTATELAEILENHGINIALSSGKDSFVISVLTTKNEYPLTLELMNEIFNNANFDEHEIEKVKNNMFQEIKQSEDEPLTVAVETFKHALYGGSLYDNSIYTLEKAIPSVAREDLFYFYDSMFNGKNIVVSINGKVDKKLTLNKFSEMFNSKSDKVFSYDKYSVPAVSSPVALTKHPTNTNTAWIIIGWQTAGLKNLKEVASLQIIDSILGSGMDSRLFKNVRAEGGLAYQIGSGMASGMLKGHFITYIGTNPDNINLATEKMLREINRMKTEFVSKQELQEAKDKIIGHYLLEQETNLQKASTLAHYEATGRGFNYRKDYEKLLNSITESDIIDVANKIFNDNYVKVIVK
ncbi:insulinase family protein [bacterium]|nr:insulinase family protein [bacterium]